MMKTTRLITGIAFILIFVSKVTAQLPVSLMPEKKKIAFEEFTGIYCSGCPSGHLISDGIKDNYPNEFFPIYFL